MGTCLCKDVEVTDTKHTNLSQFNSGAQAIDNGNIDPNDIDIKMGKNKNYQVSINDKKNQIRNQTGAGNNNFDNGNRNYAENYEMEEEEDDDNYTDKKSNPYSKAVMKKVKNFFFI